MKVFIYRKQDSEKIMEVEDVKTVIEKKDLKEKRWLHILTTDDEFIFDTKKYKSVIYQN